MAKRTTKKKDDEAKARKAITADESPAEDWLAERHAEEQAKMDNGAVKDVTLDPKFTPAVADPNAGPAKSKDVQADRAAVTPQRGTVQRKDAEAEKARVTPSVADAAPVRATTRRAPKSGSRGPRSNSVKGASHPKKEVKRSKAKANA